MTYARAYHESSALTNGKVLIVGGVARNVLRSAELYDPSTQSWTTTNSMKQERYFHAITSLLDGNQLVTGGANVDQQPFSSAEIYDATTGNWTSIQHMHDKRAGHTATLLSNGKVLIIGGATEGEITLKSTELYNPSTGTWTKTSDMHQK